MMLLKKLLPILMLPAATACATAGPPIIVSDACPSLRAITYAQLPAGQTADPGNQADSDATVRQIETHNVKYDALCPAKTE